MINWGIIGCGRIAAKFADDLNKIEGAKLYAVASRSIDKAINFGKTYNAVKAFGSYQELVEDQTIDVVYIATPHPMHKAHTILTLENNKHVLCEKPFAMNTHEVKSMIAKSKGNDKFLMEAIWTMFFPYMFKLKELIADGVLGEVKMIEADFGFKADFDPASRLFDKELGGGALLDIGIYPLSLCQMLLGKPDEISALSHLGQTGIDESTAINLKWIGGAMASLNCTILTDTKCVAKIFGTKAYIEIDSRWHESKSMHLKDRDGIIESYHFEDEYLGFAYEIKEVNNCILQKKLESEQVDHQFSLELMQTIDLIRESIGLRYPADLQ